MAKNFNNKGVQSIAADDTYVIGVIGAGYNNGANIQFKKVAAFDGSLQLVGRSSPAMDWLAIPYNKKHLNGVVADNSSVSTAITDASLITVDAESGLEIALICTGRTTGSMDVEVTRPIG